MTLPWNEFTAGPSVQGKWIKWGDTIHGCAKRTSVSSGTESFRAQLPKRPAAAGMNVGYALHLRGKTITYCELISTSTEDVLLIGPDKSELPIEPADRVDWYYQYRA